MGNFKPLQLPRGVRRHIRREKAVIRMLISDPEERAKKIRALYEKFGVTVR